MIKIDSFVNKYKSEVHAGADYHLMTTKEMDENSERREFDCLQSVRSIKTLSLVIHPFQVEEFIPKMEIQELGPPREKGDYCLHRLFQWRGRLIEKKKAQPD